MVNVATSVLAERCHHHHNINCYNSGFDHKSYKRLLTFAFEKLRHERILVSTDHRFFVGENTGKRFTPIGFNYDHDEHFRLLEDYWHIEWEKVEKDFANMRALGANIVRIHLQFGKFILSPDTLNERELLQLDRLIQLAASQDLYLDLVGLACYHGWDVPKWYNTMDFRARWDVQAFFWKTMAKRYAGERTIFCFDLMNEPVVPGKKREAGAWLGAEFAGKTYIQFITLDGTQELREKIACDWLKHLSQAIRHHDPKRLVTVGLVDWSLPSSRIKSGFLPKQILPYVDFMSAHLYPETGKLEKMLKTLNGFCVGKPLVIDETFHLKCSVEEQEWFLQQAATKARGFCTFYTDFVPEELDYGHNRVGRETRSIFKKALAWFAR